MPKSRLRFVRDLAALGECLLGLKQRRCAECGAQGTLNCHSKLYGNDPASTQGGQAQRGQRVWCCNRGRRGGCGRTFSIFLAEVLPRHTVRAGALWCLLERLLAGGSIQGAVRGLRLPYALESLYHLLGRLRQPAERGALGALPGAAGPSQWANRSVAPDGGAFTRAFSPQRVPRRRVSTPLPAPAVGVSAAASFGQGCALRSVIERASVGLPPPRARPAAGRAGGRRGRRGSAPLPTRARAPAVVSQAAARPNWCAQPVRGPAGPPATTPQGTAPAPPRRRSLSPLQKPARWRRPKTPPRAKPTTDKPS